MNAVIEIDGNMLCGNPLMYIYYRQITGRDLASDQVRAAKTAKKFEYINNSLKNNDMTIEELSEDSLKAMDEFSVDQFIIDLYYAGRCAAEGKSLPYIEVISNMPLSLLNDSDQINELFSILNINYKNNGSGNGKKK